MGVGGGGLKTKTALTMETMWKYSFSQMLNLVVLSV